MSALIVMDKMDSPAAFLFLLIDLRHPTEVNAFFRRMIYDKGEITWKRPWETDRVITVSLKTNGIVLIYPGSLFYRTDMRRCNALHGRLELTFKYKRVNFIFQSLQKNIFNSHQMRQGKQSESVVELPVDWSRLKRKWTQMTFWQ